MSDQGSDGKSLGGGLNRDNAHAALINLQQGRLFANRGAGIDNPIPGQVSLSAGYDDNLQSQG